MSVRYHHIDARRRPRLSKTFWVLTTCCAGLFGYLAVQAFELWKHTP